MQGRAQGAQVTRSAEASLPALEDEVGPEGTTSTEPRAGVGRPGSSRALLAVRLWTPPHILRLPGKKQWRPSISIFISYDSNPRVKQIQELHISRTYRELVTSSTMAIKALNQHPALYETICLLQNPHGETKSTGTETLAQGIFIS